MATNSRSSSHHVVWLTVLAALLLSPSTVNAEGGPHLDKGALLLLGFLAVSAYVLAIGLCSWLLSRPMTYITQKRKPFWLVWLFSLALHVAAMVGYAFAGELIAGNEAFAFILSLLFAPVAGFLLCPGRRPLRP